MRPPALLRWEVHELRRCKQFRVFFSHGATVFADHEGCSGALSMRRPEEGRIESFECVGSGFGFPFALVVGIHRL